MRRQLYRGGGIAGLYPRQKYGIGSWVKERVRKLIPNELADVAVKAAPFVAPFNPGIAGLMRGIGRFDQRGSISDALKQGALTYGGGQLARQLGGAGVQTDFLGTPGDRFRDRFTTPLSQDRMEGLRNLFKAREKTDVPVKKSQVKAGDWRENLLHTYSSPVSSEQSTIKNIWNKWQGMSPGLRTAIVGVGTGALAGVAQWFENQIPQEQGESMEAYMARRSAIVGDLMLQYMDNTRAFDAEWTGKTLEQKKEEIARLNKNQGGRVGYQTGGISMANTLQENIRRNQAAQQQFSESIAPTREAVLQGIKAASIAAAPKSLTGPTTKLYHGTTRADPFSGTKFFASPDKATAAQYARSGVGYGNPLSKAPVTGRILEAEVPTSQAQSLLKKGLTGTRETVLDPQAAKTLFETGKGTLKGAGSLATKAALAGTKAIPYVGGAVSLADAALRAKEGDYIGAGLGAAGAVPVLGLPALGAQVVYDQLRDPDARTTEEIARASQYGDGVIGGTEELELVQEGTNKATGSPEWRVVNDPTLWDSEFYRNNPDPFIKDRDRWDAAYAKATGGGKTRISSDGQIVTDFGNWDPGNTYQKYVRDIQRYSDYDARPLGKFYEYGPESMYPNLSEDRIAELKEQEKIMAQLYGAPGGLDPRDRPGYTNTGFTPALMNQGGRVGLRFGTPEEGIKSLDAGAPDITYEGNRPAKKQEMKMAGPDWYIKRIENLMYNFNMSYEEAGEIAYDSDKYYEVIGHDPYAKGPVLPSPEDPINPFAPKPQGPVLPDKMMAAKGGRIKQLYGTGPAGLPGIPRMAPDGMEFDMRQNGGFQGLGAKEKKDDVPAMLAKNEFVFTADAVRGAGGGDIELGAQRMYDTMKNLERRVV